MTYASVAGAEIYYEEYGPATGPAIVFAHGAGGNHLSWWQQLPAFWDRYRCISFAHRRFGQSKDVDGRGGAAFVDDLEGLLGHLGIEKVRLVAQSMGGWTCLGFALRHPDRVERLVMADTHGGLRTDEIAEAMKSSRGLAGDDSLPPWAHPGAGRRMAKEQPALALLYSQVQALNPPSARENLGEQLRAAGQPTGDEAAALTVPILYIVGEEDEVIAPPVIEAAAKCYPNARLERVPRAGHSVYWERADVFNKLVADFLA
ncbi:MAG: alpha/beta hydrolase [Dehalococcoidia bacterium]|nr:alpha/beta hydrolase [Dehalococcoidia bacterium]MCA9844160.1 alpha/beta hydrolase [Dehalococcoidia bacterium]MCA9852283.1 alpha/beta hydrolase [Dehalococcoidia bacterium]